MTFSEAQKKYDAMAPIKLGSYKKCTYKRAADFIERFITDYYITKPTVYVSNGSRHCGEECLRSLGDIYRVTKFYFPRVTLKDVKLELQQLYNDNKLAGQYCYNIKKFVHYVEQQTYGRGFKTPRPDGKGGLITTDEHGWEFEYSE